MCSSFLLPLLSVTVIMFLLAEVTASESVEVKDQPPQMKVNYETSIVAEVATTARIICPVYGTEDRKPLVTWTRNGNLVHIGWDRYRTSRAGLTLLIDNVQEMDNGLYTCSASNGFGTVTGSLHLTVLPSANFTAYGRESTTLGMTSRDLAKAQLNNEGDDEDADKSSLMIFNDLDVRVEAMTSSIPTNAIDETEYDVIMTSLLCMGSAVVMTSLGALIATAVRRRIQYRRDRRAVVAELSAHRLLTGDKQSYLYYPTATITSCSTLIGSHSAERHNDVGQSASPKSCIAMETANKSFHGQRCGACVNRESNERPMGDQSAPNGVRLTLTWPQTAVDCDSSYCYCSTFGSLESCSASV